MKLTLIPLYKTPLKIKKRRVNLSIYLLAFMSEQKKKNLLAFIEACVQSEPQPYLTCTWKGLYNTYPSSFPKVFSFVGSFNTQIKKEINNVYQFYFTQLSTLLFSFTNIFSEILCTFSSLFFFSFWSKNFFWYNLLFSLFHFSSEKCFQCFVLFTLTFGTNLYRLYFFMVVLI